MRATVGHWHSEVWIGPRRSIYLGQTVRKGGTQSYGPSSQRSSYEHCDKGKPGATSGRKAAGLNVPLER